MKLLAVNRTGIALELDATDCLTLADALHCAVHYDMAGDYSLIQALRSALRLGAVVAAYDTIRDSSVPEVGQLAHTREVWGPLETSRANEHRAPEPQ